MRIYGAPRHTYPDNNLAPTSKHTGSSKRARIARRNNRKHYKRLARIDAKHEISKQIEQS